ncbi:MAG: DUF255 domain-containing protein [Bacteroidota bacterium]|nr:DUF255 domain-containing protein [Bacteroidota bacterium]
MNKLITLAFLSIINFCIAQEHSSPVKWLTFDKAILLSKENPKKIFIDTYTDWCGWCKRMDAITFTNPVIAEILNKYYYPVKLNGEYKDTIIYKGYTFINPNPSGMRSPHQLVMKLLDGRLGFPAVVFLDENQDRITTAPGYREPAEMEIILNYIKDNAYKSMKFEEYKAKFTSKISK